MVSESRPLEQGEWGEELVPGRVAEQESDCQLLCELRGIGVDSAGREESILLLVPSHKDARVLGLEDSKS